MKISFVLSDELIEKVDQVAQAYGFSRSDFIRFCVREKLERLGVLKGVVSLGQPTPNQLQKEGR